MLTLQEWLDQKELPLNKSHELSESLWVKIKDRTNKGRLVFGVSHRLPDEGESVNKASFFNYRNHGAPRLSSQWGIATTWTDDGKAVQQAVGNSGDSRSVSELLDQVLEKASQRRVTGHCAYQCE